MAWLCFRSGRKPHVVSPWAKPWSPATRPAISADQASVKMTAESHVPDCRLQVSFSSSKPSLFLYPRRAENQLWFFQDPAGAASPTAGLTAEQTATFRRTASMATVQEPAKQAAVERTAERQATRPRAAAPASLSPSFRQWEGRRPGDNTTTVTTSPGGVKLVGFLKLNLYIIFYNFYV